MSTRLYPLYVKGNPQLRIFLPDFWMKLVKPKRSVPANQVHFIVPLQMTKHDIKSYLEKIYNVPVAHVRTKIYSGDVVRDEIGGYLKKEEDYRMAYVALQKDYKFEFPNLYPDEKKEKEQKELKDFEQRSEEFRKNIKDSENRCDVPSWFGI